MLRAEWATGLRLHPGNDMSLTEMSLTERQAQAGADDVYDDGICAWSTEIITCHATAIL